MPRRRARCSWAPTTISPCISVALDRCQTQQRGLRPWQFWRTVPTLPGESPGLLLPRNHDDVGRASLSAIAFRLVGGVAPFMPLWLAFFACVPVLGWLGYELSRAGYSSAGI